MLTGCHLFAVKQVLDSFGYGNLHEWFLLAAARIGCHRCYRSHLGDFTGCFFVCRHVKDYGSRDSYGFISLRITGLNRNLHRLSGFGTQRKIGYLPSGTINIDITISFNRLRRLHQVPLTVQIREAEFHARRRGNGVPILINESWRIRSGNRTRFSLCYYLF